MKTIIVVGNGIDCYKLHGPFTKWNIASCSHLTQRTEAIPFSRADFYFFESSVFPGYNRFDCCLTDMEIRTNTILLVDIEPHSKDE